jgi:hypothetical protein
MDRTQENRPVRRSTLCKFFCFIQIFDHWRSSDATQFFHNPRWQPGVLPATKVKQRLERLLASFPIKHSLFTFHVRQAWHRQVVRTHHGILVVDRNSAMVMLEDRERADHEALFVQRTPLLAEESDVPTSWRWRCHKGALYYASDTPGGCGPECMNILAGPQGYSQRSTDT